MTATEYAHMPGIRKAAIVMVMLGEQAASEVCRHLGQHELELLTHEISNVPEVSPELGERILDEYYGLSLTQQYLTAGGPDYANRLLVKAFGEDGARELLDQVVRAQEDRAGNLDSLRHADPQQLVKFLEGEHPQTLALILAHLGQKLATSLLLMLPEDLRAEVVRRLAEMREFSPEMAQKVATALNKKLQAVGDQSRRGYAGVRAVADLLNRLEAPQSKAILEAIEVDAPELTVSIRNLMFTFEDLLGVPEKSIREFLTHVDKKVLAMALKGASEELKAHVYKSMSSRAVEMLKDDMEALGPVRSKDVTHAQQEAVLTLRKLEAQGKVTLRTDTEDEYVV